MSLNLNRQHPASPVSIAVRNIELKADDDLQIHRQKLARLILDEMRQCAVLLDPQGTVLEANRAALACAGAAIDEVRGIPFWEASCWKVSEATVRQQRLACRRAARGERIRYDVEIYGRGGKEKIVIDYSLVPVRNNQGEVVFLLAEGRDITERKAAEARLERKDAELKARLEHVEEIEHLATHYEEILARLAESEAKFRVIADAMPQMVWSTRPDGFHDYYNRQWYEFTGVRERETDGDKWNGMFHPDDQPRAWAAWQYSLRTGEPYEIEYRLRHRSGQYRWTLGRALPVRDETGKIVRWMGTCTDIDDQKHMIEALRDSEERYRTLFNMMNEAFALCEIIVDEHGKPIDYRHLVANPAFERVGNYASGYVIGKTARELAPLLEDEWVALFGDAALHVKAVRREGYVAALGKYFDARAFGLGNGRFAYLLNDVTERKRIEQERKETEDRLQLAVDIAHLGFWQWDAGSGYCYFSPQWKQQLGYQDDELENSTHEWRRHLHPEDRRRALDMIGTCLDHGSSDCRFEYRMRHRDGSYRWMIANATAMPGQTMDGKKLIGTQLDVTEIKLAEQRVLEAARHDPLTGLPNRALVFEYASHLLAAARRNHGQGAILFIDLDRFKPINDLYGHEIGDRLLQQVASRLTRCVREEDLVGRLGGDEFVIVLPFSGNEYPDAAVQVAQHAIDALSQPFEVGSLDLSISASIGISHFPQHGTNVDALVHAADLAMYQTKQSVRGNYHIYTADLDRRADASSSIEARLKRALQNDGFTLHYQPVVDMKSGRVIGAEALLRLNADGESAIGPDRFIPVAESAGLIGRVGEWVAAEACRQHEEWRREGLPPVTIAINVSPLQFRQRGFVKRLHDIIDSFGTDPAWMQIEVTESTVMDNVEDAIETLNDIKSMGIKIALDDFGTGYSSLSHLSNLPLDKLKVDQSFVRRIGHDRASRAITEAIIALGRSLDLEVVGEGIDSEDALSYLQQQGCDQAQGFFISRPLPAAEFGHWYRQATGR